jgi:hypothetical protein
MRLATTEAALEVNLLDLINETEENPLSGKIPAKEIMNMLRVIMKVTTPERDHEKALVEMTETMDQAENIDDEAEAETEMMMGEEIAHTIATQEGVIQAGEVAESEIELKAPDQVTTTPPKITLDIEKIAEKIAENVLMT